MDIDDKKFAPPADLDFQVLLRQASDGKLPVFGAVIETDKVTVKRAYEEHRPENMEDGKRIVQAMGRAWQAGRPTQPWLYVKDGSYIVADDYFCLALIEAAKPVKFAAQILGEPLKEGLVQKVGPLGPEFVHRTIGKF